jgi:murein DD-endopeptidase MepM/ murein hydrolase activator NlpD
LYTTFYEVHEKRSIMTDITPSSDNLARYKSRDSLIAFTALFIGVIITLLVCYEHSFKPRKIAQTHRVPLPTLPRAQHALAGPEHPEQYDRMEVIIEQGSSWQGILAELKVARKQIKQVLRLRARVPEMRLKPYHKLEVFIDKKTSRLARICYYFSGMQALILRLTATGIHSDIVKQKLEPHIHFAAGVIRHSLYGAAEKAGLTEKLIYQLIANFSWDIDFHKDIHPGDRFAVIYDDFYLRDKKINDGNILAALFITRGKVFEAIRHTTQQGRTEYYAINGRNIRTAFLRAPLHYRRISSPFNLFRMHPVLHHIKPHRGVDYAAPWGTPIKATGNGKITFIGRKGGYGKTVVIQHGSRYKTLYAHLSRFAKKSKTNAYIRQGQVIGYVGQTGMATGPHVHYEFHVDGAHVNPTTAKLPRARPIANLERKRFFSKANALIAELKLYLQTFDGHYSE